MRFSKWWLWLLVFALSACAGGELSVAEANAVDVSLVKVNTDALLLDAEKGLFFYENVPFSGTAVTAYPDGNPAVIAEYVAGKRHGLLEKFFVDGKPSFRSQYVLGKQEGVTMSWWKNGNLRTETNYVNGVANGTQMQYYKSGAKFKRLELVDGKEEGMQRSWRENGSIFSNYEAKNGRIYGLKRSKLCFQLDDEQRL